MSIEQIFIRAKNNPQRVAFPEANDETTMKVAYEVKTRGYGFPILIGDDIAAIKALCNEMGYDESVFTFIDVTDENLRDSLVERYIELPDITLGPKTLKKRMADPLKFALVMEAVGDVDLTVSGFNTKTNDVILAALDILGKNPDADVITSVGLISGPHYNGSEGNVIAFSDPAVRVDPSASELASIAIMTCDTIHNITGWTPRCAMLSFSSDGSAKHAFVDKIKEAVAIANQRRPDLFIDGEFQLDSAIDPTVASKKIKRSSEVAGKANIIIFPDINAGNIGVKLMQQFGEAELFGVQLQGFRKMCIDCSRGATVEELVGNIALAIINAAEMEKKRP